MARSIIANPQISSRSLFRLEMSSFVKFNEPDNRSSFCCRLTFAYVTLNSSLSPSASWICRHSKSGVKSILTFSLSRMSNSSRSSKTSSIAELSLKDPMGFPGLSTPSINIVALSGKTHAGTATFRFSPFAAAAGALSGQMRPVPGAPSSRVSYTASCSNPS